MQASLTGGAWTMQGWDGLTNFAPAAGPMMDDAQHLTTITGTVGGVAFLNVAYTG